MRKNCLVQGWYMKNNVHMHINSCTYNSFVDETFLLYNYFLSIY